MCARDGFDPRFPRSAETVSVISNREIEAGVFSLAVSRVSVASPRPGQFFMLRSRPSAVFLGRPISVYRSDSDSITFLILKKGEGTAELCGLRSGDLLDLVGPVGNTFRNPAELIRSAETGTASDGTVLSEAERQAIRALGASPRIAVIGGGIGVAPVAGFALASPEAGGLSGVPFDFYASFRNLPYALEGLAEGSQSLTVTTEDGSAGTKGMLPAVFNPAGYDLVYACGPTPMLKYVKDSCAGRLAYLSLEKRMACGAGACLGCTVETTFGNRRCCVDGPVFNAAEVLL